MVSPSALRNHGQDFGVWLRSLLLAYTSAFAGYADSTGPFRFVSTALTVPARQVPPANGGAVLVALGHNGGATRARTRTSRSCPAAALAASATPATRRPAGSRSAPGPVTASRVSIYYDRNGHYSFIAADTTQGTGQAVSAAALYAGQMPLNFAEVLG